MKLELKHIQHYPPTLKILWQGVVCTLEGIDYDNNAVILERVNVPLDEIKLILVPLRDLKVTQNRYGVYNWEYPLEFKYEIERGITSYNNMINLFEDHIDVFGLIDNNLAITYKDIPKI